MMRGMKWWLVSLLLLVACGGGGGGSQKTNTLRIGGLLSLTGGWASLGQTSQAAMELAADDVNAYLEQIGSDLRVEIEIADTKLDPDLAAAALQDFAHDGVRVVVGPQSSAEVRAIKPIAEQRGVLSISQGSTAHSLAVRGVLSISQGSTAHSLAIRATTSSGSVPTTSTRARRSPR